MHKSVQVSQTVYSKQLQTLSADYWVKLFFNLVQIGQLIEDDEKYS